MPRSEAPTPGEEFKKRQALTRLRQRYGEAQKIAAPGGPAGHLEWILGSRRNQALDEAALSHRMAELVVLWLEDLTAEIHGPFPPPGPEGSLEGDRVPDDAREAAARDLRAATDEFAAAFLHPASTLGCTR